jgi:tetratricopeptide (TPR) repeat protein
VTEASARAPGCPSAETLAAFIDGRLEEPTLTRIQEHIAGCDDCYEAVVEITKSVGIVGPANRHIPVARPRWRRLVVPLAVAAALAAIAIWIAPTLLRRFQVGNALEDLIDAVGSARFTEARLSDAFTWGPRPSATRSGDGRGGGPLVQAAAARVTALTAGDASGEMLRARGVALLARGDLDEAIEVLRRAGRAQPDARTWSDLAAALLERQKRRGSRDDAVEALAMSDRAVLDLPDEPAVLFNRALAIETVHGIEASQVAWQRYLQVDGSSPWATEARGRLR